MQQQNETPDQKLADLEKRLEDTKAEILKLLEQAPVHSCAAIHRLVDLSAEIGMRIMIHDIDTPCSDHSKQVGDCELQQARTMSHHLEPALAVEEPQPAPCVICDPLYSVTHCCESNSCVCETYGGHCFRCDKGFWDCECKCGKCKEQRPRCTCTCGCPEERRRNETNSFFH